MKISFDQLTQNFQYRFKGHVALAVEDKIRLEDNFANRRRCGFDSLISWKYDKLTRKEWDSLPQKEQLSFLLECTKDSQEAYEAISRVHEENEEFLKKLSFTA